MAAKPTSLLTPDGATSMLGKQPKLHENFSSFGVVFIFVSKFGVMNNSINATVTYVYKTVKTCTLKRQA
ncbi:hypothetical protein OK016_01085 [Vibrio chagasii]|nr:hypothetical protein [Vibrio chagasii]